MGKLSRTITWIGTSSAGQPPSLEMAPTSLETFFKAVLRLSPLLLPLMVLLPGIEGFPYPSPHAAYSDLAVTHYPNAIYLLRALKEWRTIPLWSPAILSGAPFAANPLSGLWYPPGWLALLAPLPLGFNLLVMLHLLWGGIGMYRLLRVEGLAYPAALFGALAFESMPKLFAHFGAGHLTLLYAVPWTPWLLWRQATWGAARLSEPDPKVAGREVPLGRLNRLAGLLGSLVKQPIPPGVLLALIVVADPRWGMYAGALWWSYALAHSHYRVMLKSAANLLKQSCLATLLAAPLLLPALEYTQLSSRAHLSVDENLSYALPPARLLGFFFPDLGGFHEWALYPGALVLVLALVALLRHHLPASRLFWLWVVLIASLLALGNRIPILSNLARLPGLDLLRVPARALFLSGLALAVLSGIGLDGLWKVEAEASAWRIRMALVALAGFGLALTAGVWGVSGSLPANFIWGAVALMAGAGWVVAGLRAGKRPSPAWLAGAFLIGLIDLAVVTGQSFTTRNVEQVFAEGYAPAAYLAAQPGPFRVYSPSYSLPQHTAAQYGLELADGVDPLQLEAYSEYMEPSTGVAQEGYSVTLPPFKNGDPMTDNASSWPDPGRLGRLNVRWIVAEYDLPVEGLALRERFGETRLYENLRALPRAWVEPDVTAGTAPLQAAQLLAWTPQRILVSAKGPGVLVLSEIFYPGWRAASDGQSVAIRLVDSLLRGVQIGPGRHTIEFIFRPWSLYIGLALCACSLFWWILGDPE